MTIESELIPFESSPLRGERLLVIAPHPDDEVIGCGGLIAQHTAEGRGLRVIVITDGAAAEESIETDAYRAEREAETNSGLAELGAAAATFLRLPDRSLDSRAEELRTLIRAELADFQPDLIAVPSPVEIHPDHVAVSRALVEAVQEQPELLDSIPLARVAFYEISQPFRPNTLVDITGVATAKYEAIGKHTSQHRLRDYSWFARGLNQYRSMTLPSTTRFAEAYYVVGLAELRRASFSELGRQLSPSVRVSIAREMAPITVVVRTRDRLPLLREALESIERTQYPAQIVVVNDGGESPAEIVKQHGRATLIETAVSRGRSAAMNSGVRAAATPWISFLDDDDLFYPDHLAVLSRAAETSPVVYSDAVSAFYRIGSGGEYEVRDRLTLFGRDFDPDLLLIDNYIPLPTLLVRREDFLDAGGFSSDVDLFEDWDFLIRLSEKRRFVRVPKITCEIRHFEGSTSLILAAPEGSEEFRAAKLRIWRRHESRMTQATFLAAWEREKRLLEARNSAAVEAAGRAHHLAIDVARLLRDTETLARRVDAERAGAAELRGQLDQREVAFAHVTAELEHLREQLDSERQSHASSLDLRDESLRMANAEIERLNSLLGLIYGSRTWKMHRLMEKIRRPRG